MAVFVRSGHRRVLLIIRFGHGRRQAAGGSPGLWRRRGKGRRAHAPPSSHGEQRQSPRNGGARGTLQCFTRAPFSVEPLVVVDDQTSLWSCLGRWEAECETCDVCVCARACVVCGVWCACVVGWFSWGQCTTVGEPEVGGCTPHICIASHATVMSLFNLNLKAGETS